MHQHTIFIEYINIPKLRIRYHTKIKNTSTYQKLRIHQYTIFIEYIAIPKIRIQHRTKI